MITRRHLVALSAASAVAHLPISRPAFAQAVATQGWPNRVVKLVVPFTPGGGIDGIGRIIGARLSEMWGQQVVVENKPGAGGNIASDFVAKSPPDGYTMLLHADSGITINPHVYSRLTFDPLKDLLPVASVATNQF